MDVARLKGTEAERQALLTRLDESLALLDAFWKGAPIGLGFVNTDLRYIRVNDHFASMHGIPVAAHIGRAVSEVEPSIDPRLVEHLERVLQTGKPIVEVEAESHGEDTRGEPRWWIVSYYPVKQGDETLGVGMVVKDITARKHTELDLVDARRRIEALATERGHLLNQAEEAVRARDVFLAVASHELRTPLTPLRLSLQILERELAKRPDQERLSGRVEVALRQIDRLALLVENMLDIARGTMGWKVTVEPRAVDVAQLVRDAVARVGREAARARSQIALSLESPAIAWIDPAQIDLVLASLLSNAIKYGAGKPIEVSVRPDGEVIRVTVQDHGVGIAPDERERIFGLFARAVSERRYGGLGLGLYIAKQIVDAHGGRITCESEPGHGATFEVELPAATSTAKPIDPGQEDV
jgi:PAS domain S-box-containing protein